MKQIIYIVTTENHAIEVWELLNTGQMFLIQRITIMGEGQPIEISKKRKKLYIGIRPNYKILTYNILSNGKLQYLSSTKIPYSPNYIALDKEENFLFCAYYHANCMSISYINKNHIPTYPIKIFHNLPGCHSVNIDNFNKLAFVPALLADRIYTYKLKILKNSISCKKINFFQASKKSGPRHMTIHKHHNILYSINELNGTVDVFKINYIKKNIEIIQNISIFMNLKKSWSADIHLTLCNNYLYASDRLHNTITTFKVNKNGTLQYNNLISTTQQPKSFAIDQNNEYLISIGKKSNTIIVYNISMKNGFLSKLYEYSVHKHPTWILIHQI
ncbi:beta-propeller fold lactonase family protein [Buchnera aphidicola]|uniref:beta-propeller fold lactonase family protein n=1 Tax=Buchnera aphidicola TaxID=9 RepID=UPI0031B82EB4